MVLLEIAAAAVIILGLVAALNRGWFQRDPDPATAVPAAILQDDGTATPGTEPEETSTPLPTEASNVAIEPTATLAPNKMEPTVVPPGNIPNTIWAVTLPDGESMDFGGMLVDDDTVYRLLATSSFVGVQAVDAENGAVKWQMAHQWAGNLFAIEDDTLFFDGGGNTLTAVNAETGAELWRANVEGNPIAIDSDDDRVFVLLDTDFVTAIDEKTGNQLWVAQGSLPASATGGSASIPASLKIAVENNVVAAISTYGVLSGFDVATGTELWSHDGYDAAMTTVQGEEDVFVVTYATLASSEMMLEAAQEAGTVSADAASSSDISAADADACQRLFISAAAGSASPEAGAVTSGGVSQDESGVQAQAGGGIQAIDPATGAILWEQQRIGATLGAVDATGSVSACTVSVATGQVHTVNAIIDAEDADDTVVVGFVTGGAFSLMEQDDDVAILSVLSAIGNVSDGPEGFIAIVGDDSGIYGTMADGTLIKIGQNQQSTDDDHHEDRDDDSDDSTPDSDDD